jgi:alpha-tubulin suppressor-like RCC1 family protein
MKKEAEEEGYEFGIRKIDAADEYTATILNDGQLYVWGKNDHGQMGVGSGIGIDLVESENLPREVDLKQSLPETADADDVPVAVDVHTGMRTMLVLDSQQRLFQTGLKIDWSPKCVSLDQDKINGKIEMIASGRGHYVFVDSENYVHSFGKIFKEKSSD